MNKKSISILFLIIVFSVTLAARFQDIPVTRNLDPENHPITGFDEYQKNNPFKSTHFSELSRKVVDNRTNENCLIIIAASLYPLISDAIATYQDDLLNEELNSFLVEFSGTSWEDLRQIVIDYYNDEEIVSVTLIGNLPSAWFEMFNDFNNNGIWDPDENWVEFPIDLFFSDVDGYWIDTDGNDIYDYHIEDVHPEIGVGRIKADNLTMPGMTESEMINSYFQRNHLFRNGLIQDNNTALAYIDDDWSYWGPEYQAAMEFAYSDVELVHDINQTTASDYRENRIQAGYEFIQVHVHSGPDAHHFCEDNGNTWNLVTNYQISYLQPKSHFYNLFACSNSRFTSPNNMGAMYVFANEYCLGTLGSTKTGSMLWFEDFYEPLSLDNTIGEALRQWWEVSVDTGPDWMWERSWFYGMIIQGDPTLKVHYDGGNIVYVPDDYPTIQSAIDAVVDGDKVIVNPGTYIENINFIGKNITVASLFLITQDTTYISNTIIDGNQNGSVVTFESGEDSTTVLCGFTITNGYNIYGGGICCLNNSNPFIKNVTIKNNTCDNYGGGFYCFNSNPSLINVKILSNSTIELFVGSGGGICCHDSDPLLENVIISDNFTTEFGGGIFLLDCNSVLLDGITFDNNQSAWIGGNAYISNSHIIINNSIIYQGNAFSYGGGIYCSDSILNLLNVTISGNSALNGGGIYCSSSSPILVNCILWNDSVAEIYLEDGSIDVVYSNIQGGWEGEGNIDEDPLFSNQQNQPFHLLDASPCIGAGIDEIEINGTWYYAPEFDLEGNPRPNPAGSMPDMGAYENPLGEPQVGITNYELQISNFKLTNYPNPFNPETTISFSTTESTENTEIIIYNLKGQKVKTLIPLPNGSLGTREVVWNGTDEENQPVSSGIYFYKLNIDGKTTVSKKMILLK